MFANAVHQREIVLKRNRRVWSAVLINIYLRRRMKKLGYCYHERQRKLIAMSLTQKAATTQEFIVYRAKMMVVGALREMSTKVQFKLKLRVMMRRIINLQLRGRVAVAQKKDLLKFIVKSILVGIQTLRKAILFDKSLIDGNGKLMTVINQVLTVK